MLSKEILGQPLQSALCMYGLHTCGSNQLWTQKVDFKVELTYTPRPYLKQEYIGGIGYTQIHCFFYIRDLTTHKVLVCGGVLEQPFHTHTG